MSVSVSAFAWPPTVSAGLLGPVATVAGSFVLRSEAGIHEEDHSGDSRPYEHFHLLEEEKEQHGRTESFEIRSEASIHEEVHSADNRPYEHSPV